MDADFKNNPRISEQEESENTQESGPDSPPSILFNDTKAASTSCAKRSKRGLQKRVVSVPIKDVEGSRLKGDNATPPSDSWAWRKYGQKPIKGSPYPRGYYRCSSSKGCPARKQVERSKVDPSMLAVTYSFEHNHPSPPPSRTNHHHHHHHHNNPSSSSSSSSTGTQKPETETGTDVIKTESPEPEPENDFTTHIAGDETLITIEEFAWFGNIDHHDDQTTTTSSTILESPITAEERSAADVSFFPKMREEDESLFADLGELPECSSVFRRHRGVGPQVQIC